MFGIGPMLEYRISTAVKDREAPIPRVEPRLENWGLEAEAEAARNSAPFEIRRDRPINRGRRGRGRGRGQGKLRTRPRKKDIKEDEHEQTIMLDLFGLVWCGWIDRLSGEDGELQAPKAVGRPAGLVHTYVSASPQSTSGAYERILGGVRLWLQCVCHEWLRGQGPGARGLI
ncbi:Uncharacterized protein HZ326_26168, partial [Fusarium oxysporum f. sp. albedinis]